MFPKKLLLPILSYLKKEERKLKRKKKDLKEGDHVTNKGRVDDNADLICEAAEQEGHQRYEALTREIDKILIRIKKAMTRIKLGKYGICDGCGKMIDTDRLAIDPTASRCVNCKRDAENKSS